MKNNELKALIAAERLFFVLDYDSNVRKFLVIIIIVALASVISQWYIELYPVLSFVVIGSVYLSLYLYAHVMGVFLIAFTLLKISAWKYRIRRLSKGGINLKKFESLMKPRIDVFKIAFFLCFLVLLMIFQRIFFGIITSSLVYYLILSSLMILISSSLLLEVIIPKVIFRKTSLIVKLKRVYNSLRRRTFVNILLVFLLIYILDSLIKDLSSENSFFLILFNVNIFGIISPLLYFLIGYLLGKAIDNYYIFDLEFEREFRIPYIGWLSVMLIMSVVILFLNTSVKSLLMVSQSISFSFANYYFGFLIPVTFFFLGFLNVLMREESVLRNIAQEMQGSENRIISVFPMRSVILVFVLLNLIIATLFLIKPLSRDILEFFTIPRYEYLTALLSIFYGLITSTMIDGKQILINGAKIILKEKELLVKIEEKISQSSSAEKVQETFQNDFESTILELEKIMEEIQNSL